MTALLVSPRFFGYEKRIASALERTTGHKVWFVDERRSNSSIFRAAARLWPAFAGRASRRHFERVVTETVDRDVKYVVVIKGEVTPVTFLEKLRRLHPSATFIYYSFDSLTVASQGASTFTGFDRRSTFDPVDARRWGMDELPLFHSPEFEPGPVERRWDVAFVGTIHSNRYALWREAVRDLPPARVHAHFYVQAPWYFLLQKLRGEFAGVPFSVPTYEALDIGQTAEIFRSARAVLDVQRTGQAGLTMRTFEVLASGSGLITTNPTVKESSLYDPSYVLVAPDAAYLRTQLPAFLRDLPRPDEIARHVADYSVDAWATRLLGAR